MKNPIVISEDERDIFLGFGKLFGKLLVLPFTIIFLGQIIIGDARLTIGLILLWAVTFTVYLRIQQGRWPGQTPEVVGEYQNNTLHVTMPDGEEISLEGSHDEVVEKLDKILQNRDIEEVAIVDRSVSISSTTNFFKD